MIIQVKTGIVRHRTIAKCHILYTQVAKKNLPSNVGRIKSMGHFWMDGVSWSVKGKNGGGEVYMTYGRYTVLLYVGLRGAALVST